jgi:hypothetical protein
MMVTIFILALITITLVVGKLHASVWFRKTVEELFAQSKPIDDRKFHQQQLEGLPEPVQRYFNYALKERQPYISYARIKHDGLFKTGLHGKWINIKGEQYATTVKPGFIWQGTTKMFTAIDQYIGDKGQLTVTLLSMYNMVNGKGENYNQGELLRWLGESVLYPTNLLPDARLQWQPIDAQSAKLMFQYKTLSLFFNITFNAIGQITQLETNRYMDKTRLETWIIKATNYKEYNNLFVPTGFEVLWRLPEGDFSYAKFNITAVEYNNPKKF